MRTLKVRQAGVHVERGMATDVRGADGVELASGPTARVPGQDRQAGRGAEGGDAEIARKAVILDLPWPPSGNHRNGMRNGRHYVTETTKAYYRAVLAIVLNNYSRFMPEERLTVAVALFPPDRRRRDIDNAWKTLGDALTRAGLWADDSQIDSLTLERMAPCQEPGRRGVGFCRVWVKCGR